MYLYVKKYIYGINSGCLWPTIGPKRHRKKKGKNKVDFTMGSVVEGRN